MAHTMRSARAVMVGMQSCSDVRGMRKGQLNCWPFYVGFAQLIRLLQIKLQLPQRVGRGLLPRSKLSIKPPFVDNTIHHYSCLNAQLEVFDLFVDWRQESLADRRKLV